MNKICIIGLGYIGLPTALIAAESGLDVIGFDVDKRKVKAIMNGDAVIEEPELLNHLETVLKEYSFRATTKMEAADYFIVAVPTPFKQEKKADLSYVWSTVDTIAPVLEVGNTIILESTIPVGTTKLYAQKIEEKTGLIAGKDFYVAHCPERVLPGKIFKELTWNARVLGGINEESVQKAHTFYNHFVRGEIYLTHASAAELVKLIENSYRDVNIAFSQEVAAMAEAEDLDPFEVVNLANKHPRVNILQPSCGVGGHCLAVDPWFLIETFPQQTDLIKTARIVNDNRPKKVINDIKTAVTQWQKTHAEQPNVLLLGVTYKPNIDDTRESPAAYIAQQLSNNTSISLMVCDPYVSNETMKTLCNRTNTHFDDGLKQADIIVCLVKHTEFTTIDTEIVKNKVIIDTCGLFQSPINAAINPRFKPALELTYYYDQDDQKEHQL